MAPHAEEHKGGDPKVRSRILKSPSAERAVRGERRRTEEEEEEEAAAASAERPGSKMDTELEGKDELKGDQNVGVDVADIEQVAADAAELDEMPNDGGGGGARGGQPQRAKKAVISTRRLSAVEEGLDVLRRQQDELHERQKHMTDDIKDLQRKSIDCQLQLLGVSDNYAEHEVEAYAIGVLGRIGLARRDLLSVERRGNRFLLKMRNTTVSNGLLMWGRDQWDDGIWCTRPHTGYDQLFQRAAQNTKWTVQNLVGSGNGLHKWWSDNVMGIGSATECYCYIQLLSAYAARVYTCKEWHEAVRQNWQEEWRKGNRSEKCPISIDVAAFAAMTWEKYKDIEAENKGKGKGKGKDKGSGDFGKNGKDKGKGPSKGKGKDKGKGKAKSTFGKGKGCAGSGFTDGGFLSTVGTASLTQPARATAETPPYVSAPAAWGRW